MKRLYSIICNNQTVFTEHGDTCYYTSVENAKAKINEFAKRNRLSIISESSSSIDVINKRTGRAYSFQIDENIEIAFDSPIEEWDKRAILS